jgi:2-keto-3-deoxy-L-rhamnonate aldolase RhmA
MYEAVANFRKALDAGQKCLGAGITLADSAIVEALAPAVDFFWIDLEHTHLSYETVQNHLIAARAGGKPALVRVRGSDVAHIKPILDIGASGIIVPQVQTAQEVRAIVATCRYAPHGNRGYGPRRAANYGRDGGDDWLRRVNEQLFVAVQIENLSALAELDEIVAIGGLDSLALGPYDLSMALGHPGETQHPAVAAELDRIVTTALKAGKYVGSGMGAYARDAFAAADRGVQWLQIGDDYGYMVAQVETLFREIRSRHSPAAAANDAPTSPR